MVSLEVTACWPWYLKSKMECASCIKIVLKQNVNVVADIPYSSTSGKIDVWCDFSGHIHV